MSELEKLYIWIRLGQAAGALAVILGFLALNDFIPESMISKPEGVAGLVIGSGTFALAQFSLKLLKGKN